MQAGSDTSIQASNAGIDAAAALTELYSLNPTYI